jgi:hypothetical protein
MHYVEAPNDISNLPRPLVFLAGGITNCDEWQKEVVKHLMTVKDLPGTIVNPRRENFPMDDPNAAPEQIEWEHKALWASDVISYWFDGGESVQSITMFELGCHLSRYVVGAGPNQLIVGASPEYKRYQDVEIQLWCHSRMTHESYGVKITAHTVKEHALNIANALRKSRNLPLLRTIG